MENSNNTGKILVVFTAVVFLFFIYEVMTNTNKVNEVNVPDIKIINKPTFDPKISISDNSKTKQDNIIINRRNNNNLRRQSTTPTPTTPTAPTVPTTPLNINVISSSTSKSSNSDHICINDPNSDKIICDNR